MDWNSNQWSTTGKPYNVNILICVLPVGIGAIPRASNIKHHTCDDKNQALTWNPPGSLPISLLAFRVLILQTQYSQHMMTSSNGNITRVTGHLCGEFTGHRWIPRTKDSDAELWWFLWSAPEWMVEQTILGLVIWDAIVPIMPSQ